MDELQMVRDFFGEPSPPDPDITAAAKARMSAGGPAVKRRSTRRTLPVRPLGLPLRLGIPAVAAAAVIAAVLVIQGPAVSKSPALTHQAGGIAVFRLPGGAAAGGSAHSGREILLTAARAAAKGAQPPTPERYYVTTGNVGNFLQVGPPGNRYLVLDVNKIQFWAAANPRDFSGGLDQTLSVQAASPADETAWRRDGSPLVWNDVSPVWSLRNPTAGDVGVTPLSAAPGKPLREGAESGLQPFLVGDKDFSLRQLRALPADPAKLKSLLLTGQTGSGADAATYYLLQAVPTVLQMPVTPAVRSALYKLLADLPGVRSMGTVTDVAGQQGAAVTYTARNSDCGYQGGPGRHYINGRPLFSSCTIQQILIINPDDGMPLAEELRYTQLPAGQNWSAPDGLFSYEVFGAPYWTNQDRP